MEPSSHRPTLRTCASSVQCGAERCYEPMTNCHACHVCSRPPRSVGFRGWSKHHSFRTSRHAEQLTTMEGCTQMFKIEKSGAVFATTQTCYSTPSLSLAAQKVRYVSAVKFDVDPKSRNVREKCIPSSMGLPNNRRRPSGTETTWTRRSSCLMPRSSKF